MTSFDVTDTEGSESAKASSIMTQLHGGAGSDEFDVSTATAPKRSLPLQAIAVGLVLVVAAGTLFIMRREGTRAGIDLAGNVQIVVPPDMTLRKVENEDRILADLADPGVPDQIPAEDIHNNPFRLGEDTGPVQGAIQIDPRDAAAARTHAQLISEFSDMKLESVMNGRVPIAKISGKLYKLGDAVSERFTITRIEGRSVYVAAEGDSVRERELTMVN